MSEIRFYSAFAKTDISEPFVFELKELKIKKIFKDGMIELEYPHFSGKNDSTRFFAGKKGHPLNTAYELNGGVAYYSTDRQKCEEFLRSKIREMNLFAAKLQDRMQKSKIEIKLLKAE